MEFRTGFGKDSHAFEKKPGKPLILAGVKFAGKGLRSHSDGDVIMHAVFNAISSAVAGKSIGDYFPDTDGRWKDVDSKIFLEKAKQLLEQKGFRIVNLTVVVECGEPKIGPSVEKMRDNLARCLGIRKEKIGITATTGEGLTPFGKGLGIEATAVTLVSGRAAARRRK